MHIHHLVGYILGNCLAHCLPNEAAPSLWVILLPFPKATFIFMPFSSQRIVPSASYFILLFKRTCSFICFPKILFI